MEALTHTCPICGKPIPDYHSQDIICPACNTDLSIYRTIDGIPEKTLWNWKGWSPIAIVALVVTIAITTALCIYTSSHKTQVLQLEAKNIALDDENTRLVADFTSLLTTEKELEKQLQQGFPYIIRKGDCLWLISKRLYGTGEQVQQIAEDNGITLDTPLNIGDTLFIKY